MKDRSEAEADPSLRHAVAHLVGRKVDDDTQGLEQVRRATCGRRCAVAVLDHGAACTDRQPGGVARAAESVDSGGAQSALDGWIEVSRGGE